MRLEAAMYLNSKQFVIIFHLSFAIFAASALLSGERTGLVSTLILIAIITATNQLSGPSIVALLPDKSEITAEILANCCSPGAIVIFVTNSRNGIRLHCWLVFSQLASSSSLHNASSCCMPAMGTNSSTRPRPDR